MIKKPVPLPLKKADELRQRAEALQFQRDSRVINPLIHTDPQRLIHELQVHQIELEMQNDELRQTQLQLEASHARYLDLFDSAPVGYLTLNELGVILEANLTAAAMLGVPRSHLIRDRLIRFILPEYADTSSQCFGLLFSSGTPQACELYILNNNAPPFWARLEASLIQDKERETPLMRVVVSDISASKSAEETLRESEERYRSLFENMDEGFSLYEVIYDSQSYPYDFRFLDINPAFELNSGLTRADVIGRTLLEVLPETQRGIIQDYSQALLSGKPLNVEYYFKPLERHIHIHVFSPRPGLLATIFEDISLRKQAEQALVSSHEQLSSQLEEIEHLQEELKEQAIRDPLTGLYNRRYLYEVLAHEIARSERDQHPLSVILIDIDHFKKVNDMYGHQMGDTILVEISRLIESNTRESDIVCRYGGEEFLLVLPGASLNDAQQRAEQIRQMCMDKLFQNHGVDILLTMSLGVAALSKQGEHADEIISKADRALYVSKERGRNLVTVWNYAESRTEKLPNPVT